MLLEHTTTKVERVVLLFVTTSRNGSATEHIRLANIIIQHAGYAEDEGQKVHVPRCNYNFVYVISQVAERPKKFSGSYQFIRIPLEVRSRVQQFPA